MRQNVVLVNIPGLEMGKEKGAMKEGDFFAKIGPSRQVVGASCRHILNCGNG